MAAALTVIPTTPNSSVTDHTDSGSLSPDVSKPSAKARIADDLFAELKWIVNFASVAGERPVPEHLMGPERVVEVDV
jgi:hypothetical protein